MRVLLGVVLCLSVLGAPRGAKAFFFGFGVAAPIENEIRSERPLFDPGQGLLISSNGAPVAIVKTTTSQTVELRGLRTPAFRTDVRARANAALLVQTGGVYSSASLISGDSNAALDLFVDHTSVLLRGASFSIHRSDRPKVYIAQIARQRSGTSPFYEYRYFQLIKGRIVVRDKLPSFDLKSIPATDYTGHLSEDGQNIFVEDVASLNHLLAYRDGRQSRPIVDPNMNDYRLGAFPKYSTEPQQIRRDIFSRICRYYAQSPFDPDVITTYNLQMTGVPFGLINAEHAGPSCDAALTFGATSKSLRYSAARAFYRVGLVEKSDEHLQRSSALMEGLAAEGFALAETWLAEVLVFSGTHDTGTHPGYAALKASSDQGNHLSSYILGKHLRTGQLPSDGDAEALFYLQRAQRAGISAALGDLGMLFLARDTAEDRRRALDFLERGAEAKDPAAQQQLGVELFQQQFYRSAFKHLDKAAEAGQHYAMYLRGFMQLYGRGVSKDVRKAETSLRAAQRLGYSSAGLELAYLMCTDQVAKTSPEERAAGRTALEEAVARADTRAQSFLDKCLSAQ